MRHNPGYGIMAKLVKGRPVPVDRLVEIVGPRNSDEVMAGTVIGGNPSDPEIGTGRGDHAFGCRQDQSFGDRLGQGMEALRQPVALVDREDSELLEEGKAAPRRTAVSAPIGPERLLALAHAAAVDDANAMFAAPDRAAERRGLAEGQEPMALEPSCNDSMPERENIDAAISPVAGRVEREPDSSASRPPRLHPWKPSGFQFRYDPGGDLLIKRSPGGGRRPEGPRRPPAAGFLVKRHIQSPCGRAPSLSRRLRPPACPGPPLPPRAGGGSRQRARPHGKRRRPVATGLA